MTCVVKDNSLGVVSASEAVSAWRLGDDAQAEATPVDGQQGTFNAGAQTH